MEVVGELSPTGLAAGIGLVGKILVPPAPLLTFIDIDPVLTTISWISQLLLANSRLLVDVQKSPVQDTKADRWGTDHESHTELVPITSLTPCYMILPSGSHFCWSGSVFVSTGVQNMVFSHADMSKSFLQIIPRECQPEHCQGQNCDPVGAPVLISQMPVCIFWFYVIIDALSILHTIKSRALFPGNLLFLKHTQSP